MIGSPRLERPVLVLSLALLLVLSTLACSGRGASPQDAFDDFTASIDEEVADQARAQSMHDEAVEMQAALDDLLELTHATRVALAALVADHGSSREQFDTLFDDYLERRKLLVDRTLESHLEIKRLATDDEWKALKKAEKAVFRHFTGQTVTPES